ncbi:MAG: hypothetical protein ACRELE_00555 [Gemmatimonadales bacterium]
MDARWLGGGVGTPRWDLDGQWAYFSYDTLVSVTNAVVREAPWWRVSHDGSRIEPVTRAVWFNRGELRTWQRGRGERLLMVRADGIAPRWSAGEREVRYLAAGDLFDFIKRRKLEKDTDAAPMPIVIPRKKDETVSSLDLSPDGKYATYIISPKTEDVPTIFGDYVNDSGVVYTRTSRAKVGGPLVHTRAVIVRADSFAIPDSVKATVVDAASLGKAVRALSLGWITPAADPGRVGSAPCRTLP